MANFFEQIFKGPRPEVQPERVSPIPSLQETILTSGKATVKDRLLGLVGPRSMNFVEIEGDGAGIWKRFDSENERAAYIVDRFLDSNFVPTTVLRVFGKDPGSLQEFVLDPKEIGFIVREKSIPKEEVIKMAIFDFLICNTDRNSGNFFIKEGKIVAIDHGYAFRFKGYPDIRNREKCWGSQLPEKIKTNILAFSQWSEGIKLLRGFLEELLDEGAVDQFFERLELVVQCAKRGRFFSEEQWRKFFSY